MFLRLDLSFELTVPLLDNEKSRCIDVYVLLQLTMSSEFVTLYELIEQHVENETDDAVLNRIKYLVISYHPEG